MTLCISNHPFEIAPPCYVVATAQRRSVTSPPWGASLPTTTVRIQHRSPRLVTATLLALTLAFALLTGAAPSAFAAAGEDTLRAGQTLLAGNTLVSANGQFRTAVQGDGNVVVYGPGGPRWQTGSRGAGAELAVQGDGNVVLYGSGRPQWWTGTSGSDARLVMQSDGNLVLYLNNRAAWSITTGIIPVRPAAPAELAAGQTLSAGRQLISADGRFTAALQTDGNFVTYGPGNRVLFATGTGGTAGARLAMQTDGNLVLYGNSGARWQTGTSGSGGVLALQNDGNLVVYAGGRAAWARTTGLIGVAPPPVATRSTLNTGETLAAGQQLTDGPYVAALQTDGNFVVYDNGRAVFATNTGGTPNARLAIQADGNLVLYGPSGPRWQLGTSGGAGVLALQPDGNLVVYAGGRAVWSIRTGYIGAPSAPPSNSGNPGTPPAGPRPGSPTHIPGCDVKGNVADDGERIYHVPGGQFYDVTVIGNRPGEYWFCSPSDAQAAGWRASKR